jgi:hypothetical protein
MDHHDRGNLLHEPSRRVSLLPSHVHTHILAMSQSLSEDPSPHPCPRPASPFFRHRPLGRAPSPPTWACYEQIPARSDILGSSDSDSDSGDAADDDSLSDVDSSSSSASSSSASPSDVEAAGLMDVESDKDEAAEDSARGALGEEPGDPEKQRDKGKQRAEDPSPNAAAPKSAHVVHSRSRRHRGRRPPMSVLRPILTIQRSQGFVWNQVRFFFIRSFPSVHLSVFSLSFSQRNETVQDLFVPPYIKDRCTYTYMSHLAISVPHLVSSSTRRCFHFPAHLIWRILRLPLHVYFSRRF